MMKSKQMSKSSPKFASGGNGKMFGKDSAGPQQPGGTAKNGKGGGKFAKGGGGKMFGKQSAGPMSPGKVGK